MVKVMHRTECQLISHLQNSIARARPTRFTPRFGTFSILLNEMWVILLYFLWLILANITLAPTVSATYGREDVLNVCHHPATLTADCLHVCCRIMVLENVRPWHDYCGTALRTIYLSCYYMLLYHPQTQYLLFH